MAAKIADLIKLLRNRLIDPSATEEILSGVQTSKLNWSEILTMDISDFDRHDWGSLGYLIPHTDDYLKVVDNLFIRFGISRKLDLIIKLILIECLDVRSVETSYVMDTNMFGLDTLTKVYPELDDPDEYVKVDTIMIKIIFNQLASRYAIPKFLHQGGCVLYYRPLILMKKNVFIDKILKEMEASIYTV